VIKEGEKSLAKALNWAMEAGAQVSCGLVRRYLEHHPRKYRAAMAR